MKRVVPIAMNEKPIAIPAAGDMNVAADVATIGPTMKMISSISASYEYAVLMSARSSPSTQSQRLLVNPPTLGRKISARKIAVIQMYVGAWL